MAYGDIEKATALEIVQRSGGKVTTAVVADVNAALGKAVTAVTLRNWLKEKKETKNFAPEKNEGFSVSDAVAQSLDEKLEEIAHRYAEHLTDKVLIAKTSAKDSATVIGITIDKMRLIRGLPTEIIALMPDVIKALEDVDLSPADVFNAIIAQARTEKARRDINA